MAISYKWLKNNSEYKQINTGVLQGTTVASTLFITCIDDLREAWKNIRRRHRTIVGT